jgi:hypothetical protein
MNTILIFIATGHKYQQYVAPVIEGADKFFVPHDTLLFTDRKQNLNINQVVVPARGFPNETLLRYHTILSQPWLAEYDYIFYSDIDMRFVGKIGPEIYADGITATIHPGYMGQRFKPVETDPRSTACATGARRYYCGGFNGGTSKAYLRMAETIRRNIDIDSGNGITAQWHDESHLNKYLKDHPPAKTLSPSYCYPSDEQREWYIKRWHGRDFERKIVCIDKP